MPSGLWFNAARGVYQDGSVMATGVAEVEVKQPVVEQKKEDKPAKQQQQQPKQNKQPEKKEEPKKQEPKKESKKAPPPKEEDDEEEEADEEEEEDDDDDFGLDDSDDDEETKALLAAKADQIKKIQARQAAKAGDAKSNLTLDIKPYDSETDMKELEKKVRAIHLNGCKWLGGELKDVAYGVKKLRIMCQLVDVLINPDTIREAVEELEDVQSTDVFAFQMA
eukprot:g13981.t1